MATRKNATKTSKRAEVDISALEDIKIKKSTKNKTKKLAKNTSLKVWIFALIFLLAGISAGLGTYFVVCKDDCFLLIGESEISLTLDESEHYCDEGVKIISFGKDISSQVKIETNLEVDSNGKYYAQDVGTYYIKYTSQDFKYGKIFKIQKVRLITFVEASEGGE